MALPATALAPRAARALRSAPGFNLRHRSSRSRAVPARRRWSQGSSFISSAVISGVAAGGRKWRKQRLHFSSLSAVAESKGSTENMALVFVKPHAATPQVLELVPGFLEDRGLKVVRSGSIGSKEIEEKGIIDAHYAAIATIGMARDLTVLGLEEVEEKFKVYGRTLPEAMEAGEVCSAVLAMEILDVDPSELLRRCLAKGYEKLRSGLYCARLEGGPTGQLFVLNGFYSRMREKFTKEGVIVYWFVVNWPQSQLPWKDFRSAVIGSTNPTDAAEGSLRARIRDEWQSLGLKEETNYQDNGVHASAGPLEALRERQVWLGDDLKTDPFGMELAATCPISLADLVENPTLEVDGKTGSAFDLLEELDSQETLKALALAKLA